MKTRPLAERFEEKWIPEPNTGCWLWIGARNPKGYGMFRLGKPNSSPAHHAALLLYSGIAVPCGLQVDHLCRVRDCVNPDHLEVVSQSENQRRGLAGALMSSERRIAIGAFLSAARGLTQPKMNCRRGHSMVDAYVLHGQRQCRTCRRWHKKLYRQRRSARSES